MMQSGKIRVRKIVKVGALQVSYTRECETEHPMNTLLFLHGWSGSSGSWSRNIQGLKKVFDCVAVDLPGFSVSPKPDKVWGIEEYALFIRHFSKALNIERMAMVGKSFGGRVAILYASRWSETLTHLILVAAAGVESKSLPTQVKIGAARVGGAFLSIFGFNILTFFRRLYHKVVKVRPDVDDYKWGVKKRVTSTDLSRAAKSIRVPTLIVWGKEDDVLPLRIGEKLSWLIRGSKFCLIPGGHNAHQECAEEFNAVVVKYCEEK